MTAAFVTTPDVACLQADSAHASRVPELDFVRAPALPVPADTANHHCSADAGEGVILLDAQGRITSVNDPVETLTGWKAEELLGRGVHDALHLPHHAGSVVNPGRCPACLALAVGESSRSESGAFWRRDGSSFPVDCTTTPVIVNGIRAGAALLFRDISERRRRDSWEKDKSAILMAITSHGDLDATLALIASAFTRLNPGCAMALLTRTEELPGPGRGSAPARGLELAASAGLQLSLLQKMTVVGSNHDASNEVTNEVDGHGRDDTGVGSIPKRSAEAGIAAVMTPKEHSRGGRLPWSDSSLCAHAVAVGREVLATRDRKPQHRENCNVASSELPGENSSEVPGDDSSGVPSEVWIEVRASGFAACLAVPLLSHESATLGVAAFFSAPADLSRMQSCVKDICDMARLVIEHQQLHSEVVRRSHHDHLTGLPNRLLLEDRLERAILHARRYGTQLAVGCIDIDHFKQINDIHGHAIGDGVLREVSRLLGESLREIDTVARQGGDEFLVILPDLKSEAEADTVCQRILTVLREPMVIGGQVVTLTASIGRTVYPLQLENASDLLQHADIALHTAKSDGRDRLVAFNYALGDRYKREIELQRELRHALEQKQFYLHYQPLYDGARALKGFEALLRWTHPRLGEIGPGEFIPLAEKSGLIIPIGGWVMNEACRQAQEWSALCASPVKMFVNVSGVQLGQPNFAETIAGALTATGLACNLLNLEITETCIVADTQEASSKLRQLRDLGVRISIDDFGCGHSTFSYLQQLPIDTLKIDRSFITCLDGTEKNSAIVRAIVALADELGLETIAEGVETGLQFDALQTTQCNLFQGFLLARPLSAYAARLVVLDHAQNGYPVTKAMGRAKVRTSVAQRAGATSTK